MEIYVYWIQVAEKQSSPYVITTQNVLRANFSGNCNSMTRASLYSGLCTELSCLLEQSDDAHTNSQQIEGMDIVKEERFLCEFALTTLMEVSKVTSASVEIATQTADGGTRIVLDDEVQVRTHHIGRTASDTTASFISWFIHNWIEFITTAARHWQFAFQLLLDSLEMQAKTEQDAAIAAGENAAGLDRHLSS